jgi:hypothetical protein
LFNLFYLSFTTAIGIDMPGLGLRKAGEKISKGGPKENFEKFF